MEHILRILSKSSCSSMKSTITVQLKYSSLPIYISCCLKTNNSFVRGRDWNLSYNLMIIFPSGKVLKSHLVQLRMRFLTFSHVTSKVVQMWMLFQSFGRVCNLFCILRTTVNMNSCMNILPKSSDCFPHKHKIIGMALGWVNGDLMEINQKLKW